MNGRILSDQEIGNLYRAGDMDAWHAALQAQAEETAPRRPAPLAAAPAPSPENDAKPVTHGFLMRVMTPVVKSIAKTFRAEDAKLREDFDARIRALETKGAALRYCGTWKADRDYSEGNFATEDGSIWHANCATTSRPGTDASWTLAVKHGRDLR